MENDDRRLSALQGKIALLQGKPITAQTRKDIDWYDEEELDRGMKNYSRAKYAKYLAKRQVNVLDQLCNTHGLPVGKPLDQEGREVYVDLFAILNWFHDYLGKYGKKCNGKAESARDEEDEIAKRKQSLDMQTLEIKLQMLQADFNKKAGNAISAEEVDQLFVWFESELRKLGERLGKRFGADAQGLFNSTLDRIGRHLEGLMPKDEGQ